MMANWTHCPGLRPGSQNQAPRGPPRHPLGRLINGHSVRRVCKNTTCWRSSAASKTSVSCRRNAHFGETDAEQQRWSVCRIIVFSKEFGRFGTPRHNMDIDQVDRQQEHDDDEIVVSCWRNAHFRHLGFCKFANSKTSKGKCSFVLQHSGHHAHR